MERCRVFVHPDGSVRVVHPAPDARQMVRIKQDGEPLPESDTAFYARVFAEAVERDPTLAGLPFHDIATSDLPPRSLPCEDADCTGEHSVRDQWRGHTRMKAVRRDASVPNLHIELDHLARAYEREIDKDEPDLMQAMSLDIQIKRHVRRMKERTNG